MFPKQNQKKPMKPQPDPTDHADILAGNPTRANLKWNADHTAATVVPDPAGRFFVLLLSPSARHAHA